DDNEVHRRPPLSLRRLNPRRLTHSRPPPSSHAPTSIVAMSSKILLEDDDDAMFGDGDEEEEEDEDADVVVVAPPPPPPPPAADAEDAAPVKAEEPAAEEEDEPTVESEPAGDDASDAKADDEGATEGEASGGDAFPPPPESADVPPPPTSTFPASAPGPTATASPLLLPTSLPSSSPSPFPHHNSGPTSDRLRNALSRVASDPDRDAEAWRILTTEAGSCWRSLGAGLRKLRSPPPLPPPPPGEGGAEEDPELESLGRKLDWIEAIRGALLARFPYAIVHYVQIAEMLIRLGARTADEEEQCGPLSALPSTALAAVGGGGGGGGSMGTAGSALACPALMTTDQGVAIAPGSLLMEPTAEDAATERQKSYDAKLEKIFRWCLGVNLDGTPALHGELTEGQSIDAESAALPDGARTVLGGIAPHSVDLWLLYVRRRTWDAAREAAEEAPIPPPPPGFARTGGPQASVLHQQYEESLRSAYRDRKDRIREAVSAAYETALSRGAGFARDNHLVWRRYANFVKSWTAPVNYASALPGGGGSAARWRPPGAPDPTATLPPPDPAHDHTSAQKQLSALRGIYQRGIGHPMTGLDQFWQEYEAFERGHSESLGSVLVAEWLPKYQHARSVYLERNRAWTARELEGGRLAVPPAGWGGGRGAKAGAGGGGGVPGMGLGGGPKPPGAAGDDDPTAAGGGPGSAAAADGSTDPALLEEERVALARWRRRHAYERTNPERLGSSDHAARVRAGYREGCGAYARHPEAWHEWGTWELLHGGGGGAAVGGAAGKGSAIAPVAAGDVSSGGNAVRAVAVLALGMESVPDCALLAQAQAEIMERHLGGGEGEGESEGKVGGGGCISVLERYVARCPTTLGFVLLQRLVRRHQGVAAARAVFARARRALRVREEDALGGSGDGGTTTAKATASGQAEKEEPIGDGKEKADAGAASQDSRRRMVTNRSGFSSELATGDVIAAPSFNDNAGYVTWHLYAAHAALEHRPGRNPRVAARVYELGLRRHRTFLSNPPYVLQYADLLLELGEEENLRSLLSRAVAACEEEEAARTAAVKEVGGDVAGADAAALSRRRETQRPLWDAMLRFESVLSSRPGSSSSCDVASVEARRRRALYGPGREDLVAGGDRPPDDEDDRVLGTGAGRTGLNEMLIRAEGYDVASRIANGMGRMVDVLAATGAIGGGSELLGSGTGPDFAGAAAASTAAGGTPDLLGDECAGGPSDASYVLRLKFRREGAARAAATVPSTGPSTGAGKLLSRERSTAAVAPGGAVAALREGPEWLRPLTLLLPPVPKFGRGVVRPPPHLVEVALSALRGNDLPSARPVGRKAADGGAAGAVNGGRKRKWGGGGGDSSDEENGNAAGGGGYGGQFRARQRSRLVDAAPSNQ
ncbi:hypothetical protein ACHAWF_010681, partial [Thalassiosira exigua]